MKRLILIALLLSPNAFADRFLNPGEMYTAQYAGERVACSGAQTQPDHYDFMQQDRADLDDAWQGRGESIARSMCEGDGQAAVFYSSVVQRLLRDANAQCAGSYNRCQQLGPVQARFISKDENRGRFGCYLRVTVRGSR